MVLHEISIETLDFMLELGKVIIEPGFEFLVDGLVLFRHNVLSRGNRLFLVLRVDRLLFGSQSVLKL